MRDDTTRTNVLVIDDDASIVRVLARLLREDGHTVDTANDGPAALALIEYRIPDLILLDASLPTIGGVALCRQLRAMAVTADTPIIMLTGTDTQERRDQAAGAGADDFIGKPYDPAVLRACVRTWIGQRHRSADHETR
jgi:DNA-binding response OmpR family regulator